MKYLTDRTEIAKAMNFGEHPVLYIDLENRPAKSYAPTSDFCVGCDVRVAWDAINPRYAGMYSQGHIYMENGVFAISNNSDVLKAAFGRQDVLDNYHWANTPLVHKGQTVVVVIDQPSLHKCRVALMKVSDRIDIHCSTVARLIELNDEE